MLKTGYSPIPLLWMLLLGVCAVKPAIAAQGDTPLVAVFPKNFPPIYTVSENGLPTGFGIEFTEEVARVAGLHIEYRSKETWWDTMQAVTNGEADLVPDIGFVESRRSKVDFSLPVHEIAVAIFVSGDNTAIREFDDLQGKLVGVVRTNIALSLLQGNPYIYIKEVASLSDLYVNLLEKKIDAAVYPAANFENLALRLGTSDHIKKVGEPLALVPRGMAVRKGNSALLAKLNPAISEVLQSKYYQRLLQRWFPAPEPYWNSQRLSILFLLILGIIGVILLVYRMLLLRRLNAELGAANRLTSAVLDATQEGIVRVDAAGKIVSFNSAGARMFGQRDSGLVKKSITWLLSGPDAHALADSLKTFTTTAPGQRNWDHQRIWECTARRNDGELFPVQVAVAPIDADDQPNFVFTLHDQSRIQQAELRAEQLLNHDPLTGLLNMRGIQVFLDTYIHQGSSSPFACFCIGLQRLTYINGTYGRQVGDEVLVQTAAALRRIVSNAGKTMANAARVGGERFVLVVPDTDVENARVLASTISREFQNYKITIDEVEDRSIQVDAGIGVACYPRHGTTADELVYHAELAFYSAKESRLETVHVFDSDESLQHSNIENALQRIKSALSSDRILLHFQPIMHLPSGEIHHYEALIRMQELDGRIIMPADIIPLAERFGLITRIDYRVLQLAVTYLASLEELRPDISIAVNLSAMHLGDSGLFSWFKSVFDESPSIAGRIIFEITETAALQNLATAKKFMEELSKLGCRFALDDFGVGFTSFAQLRNLPVDMVKIDGMFVRGLRDNPEDQALVQAITNVAHGLGKKVVAEFVGDRASLELLRSYGVDYGQGYYIGKPSPELNVENNLQRDLVNDGTTGRAL